MVRSSPKSTIGKGEMDDIHNQAGSPDGPRPLSAKDVARFLRRRLWLIILAPLAISGGSLAFSLLQTPTYEASATVLVGQQQAQGHSSPARVEELQALIPSALEIITTRPVAEEATSGLDLAIDPEAVLENLSAEQTIESGQLIEVSYTDTDARRSEQLVNAVGEVASERISRLPMSAHDIKATVVEAAKVPRTREEPDLLRNAILAAGLGTMIGFGLAFVGRLSTPVANRGIRPSESHCHVHLGRTLGKVLSRKYVEVVRRCAVG
jgi:capsular polysaccharide biosynthesis protein